MLVAENINKSIKERKILDNINLSLARGKITALLGPSGAGKTSLLRALSLVEILDSGTIFLNEVVYNAPLESYESHSYYQQVGIVFQQLFLWPHLTLRENILLPCINEIKSNYQQILADFINIFQMSEFIDRYPNEVSLGQRQRAAIARAIVLNPDFLLLDEVTSALDIEQIEILARYLVTLRDKNKGILISTHSVSFASKIADEVIFMDRGQILESGKVGLINAPVSSRFQSFVSYFG